MATSPPCAASIFFFAPYQRVSHTSETASIRIFEVFAAANFRKASICPPPMPPVPMIPIRTISSAPSGARAPACETGPPSSKSSSARTMPAASPVAAAAAAAVRRKSRLVLEPPTSHLLLPRAAARHHFLRHAFERALRLVNAFGLAQRFPLVFDADPRVVTGVGHDFHQPAVVLGGFVAVAVELVRLRADRLRKRHQVGDTLVSVVLVKISEIRQRSAARSE